MATEISQAKVNALVKKGLSQAKVAEQLDVSPGQLGMLRYGQGLVACGKLKKAPATSKSVKELRDKQNLRWEYIAAATNLSVAKVRELYGDKESYIGRGRKPGSNGSTTSKSSSKSKTASGGRGRGKAASGRPARARTRAQRAAKSGNPS